MKVQDQFRGIIKSKGRDVSKKYIVKSFKINLGDAYAKEAVFVNSKNEECKGVMCSCVMDLNGITKIECQYIGKEK